MKALGIFPKKKDPIPLYRVSHLLCPVPIVHSFSVYHAERFDRLVNCALVVRVTIVSSLMVDGI